MKRCVIGIAAHVDAGKTTLAESLLYTAGMIRRKGRVDNGTAFLDTEQVEKERGITVFSHQAVLETENSLFTLLDTPGHEDFSAQTEQAVSVMDTAILVISGTDGIQSHSLPLWRIMERHRLPVVIFVNKMDISAKSRKELLSELHSLSDRVYPYDDMEGIAGTDEALMNEYLENGELSDESLAKAFGERVFFPCVFGSALKGEGADELLRLLDTLAPVPRPKDTLSGRVFKITYDGNTRLTHLRLTGGTLSPRDFIGEEKINALRIYSGSRYTTADRIYPGMTAAAAGLTSLRPGDVFGDESTTYTPVFEPVMTYRVVPPEGMDEFAIQAVMQRLEEEEPLLGVQADSTGVHVKVMGEVQLEIISRRFSELTGKTPSFDSGTVAFLETIAAPADGAGHFEPLRHYGEVHVHMEPLPRGSGITIDSKVSEDILQPVWQNSILSALSEKRHKGVLTGAPLTDVHITLTAGKAHLKHTCGGDLREAACRAVRQGLMKAESVLLEPWYSFELKLPAELTGKALSGLELMGAVIEYGESGRITGRAPVREINAFRTELKALTHGTGVLSCIPCGYYPCPCQDEIVSATGYDPGADLNEPADSVFCSHGAGVLISWDTADEYMHISPEGDRQEGALPDITPARIARFAAQSYSDEELMEVFERTYGKIKRDKRYAVRREEVTPKYKTSPALKGPVYLLVDGYNIIFSWERLKKAAAQSLDLARTMLTDTLENFQGMKGWKIILVFDAYRVKGDREIERHGELTVIYTKEAETADSYIERATHELAKDHRVRVATSDGAEQMIILGNGAFRMTAAELEAEVASAYRDTLKEMERLETGAKNASKGIRTNTK